MKTTIEKNNLVAYYLGQATILRDRADGYVKPLSVFPENEFIFHESWDWLIPVVKKIYEEFGFDYEGVLLIREAVAEVNLNDAFQAVVDFIEWVDNRVKYIVVGTWNGSGYSDSKADVILAKDKKDIQKKIEEIVQEEVKGFSSEITKDKATVYYAIGDDSGAFSYVPFTGQYAVEIRPDLNEFTIIETKEDFDKLIDKYVGKTSNLEERGYLIARELDHCFHEVIDQAMILQIL